MHTYIHIQMGQSCLQYACMMGHLEVVKYLCDRGGKELVMRTTPVVCTCMYVHMYVCGCVFLVKRTTPVVCICMYVCVNICECVDVDLWPCVRHRWHVCVCVCM